ECGENPAVPGGELCASCLKEIARRMTDGTDDDDVIVPEEASLEIDSVSTMDEIAIDIDDPLDDEAMAADPDFKDDDEEEDDEEDDPDLKDSHDDLRGF
ncbi:MAG: hypothetical protein RR150_05430, partial [Clostridia bacterium]